MEVPSLAKNKSSLKQASALQSKIETWQDIYSPKQGPNGERGSVFMTEVSTTVGPSTAKLSKGNNGVQTPAINVKTPQFKLREAINKNFNSTAQLQKNFIFPSIQKSQSLLNLRTYSQQGGTQKKRKIDFNKLQKLAQPKLQSTAQIDLKRDKTEIAQEIIQRKDDAADFINNIYKNYEGGTINEYVTSIESLNVVKDKIEQFKLMLQQKIKEFNEMSHDCAQKQDALDELKKQLAQLELRSHISEDISGKMDQLKEETRVVTQKLDMELLHTEQLNHMLERDKLTILFMKQPIQDKKDDIAQVLNSVLSIKELKRTMQREITQYENNIKNTGERGEDKRKITDNLKEMYYQDITQQTMFDEVYKNQIKIIEDKEKELKQKRQEEIQQRQQEHQEKILNEEKKRAEANRNYAKYQEDFLEIQKDCNVKEIGDLVKYQEDQQEQARELTELTELIQSVTDQKQQRLKALKEQLTQLKYQRTHLAQGGDESQQQKVEQEEDLKSKQLLQIKENEYTHESNQEKNREEYLKRMRKMKEVIAIATTSIARIAHQLKEDQKITPLNADLKLSVCGLRLEHMVATLYKKKPTFNIESVNTDYSSNLPPTFLGIKNNIYVNPEPIEEENENELDRLYHLQQQRQAQLDEELDYVNEEYSKHKKVSKAMLQSQGNPQMMKGSKSEANLKFGDKLFQKRNKTDGLGGGNNENTMSGMSGQGQSNQQKVEKFDAVMHVLSKNKHQNINSQQMILMTDKDKELLESKSQIHKQLMKIVHRTWYIFDPDKKKRAKDTFKSGMFSPKRTMTASQDR